MALTLGAATTTPSTILLTGKSGAATTESIGAITLASGANGLIRSTVGSGAGSSNELTIASITRAVGNLGQITFDGALTGGGTTQALTDTGTNQIKFTSPPALVNDIIPFGVVTVAGTIGGGATVDTSGGFATLLGAANHVVSATTDLNNINTAAAGTHVLVTSNVAVNAATAALKSLFIDGVTTTTVSGTGTISTESLGAGTLAAYTESTSVTNISGGSPETIFVNSGTTLTISSKLTGSGGITKEGLGTVVLSNAANDYSGTTTINAGVLTASTSAALGVSGPGNNTTVGSGTTLNIQGSSTIADDITLGTAGGGGATLGFPSGNNSVTGSISLVVTSTFSVSTAGTTQLLPSTISGSGGLTKSGAGTLEVSGVNNSYAGTTNVASGPITVHHLANGGLNSSIGASSNAASNLLIGNGATLLYAGTGASSTNRLFTINGTAAGHGATIATAAGSGALSFTNPGSLANGSGNQTRTLTLNALGSNVNSFSPNIVNNGTGATSLTKTGTGTWAIEGTKTYTGSTTVSAGTLLVNGTTNAGSAFTVASGATLGGGVGTTPGTINGTVLVNSGGTLAPGPGTSGATGNLITGALTLASGSTYKVDLNGATVGSGYDQTDVGAAATVTLTGATLNASGLGATGQNKFVIVDNAGTDPIVGTFSGLLEGATVTIGDIEYTISYVGVGGLDAVANDVVLTETLVKISSVVFDAGLAGAADDAQRSMVKRVQVGFDRPVPAANLVTGNGAFEIINVNEMQRVVVGGTGTFKLTFGLDTTVALQSTALPATVEAELNALPSIFSVGGQVKVVGGPRDYTIVFGGAGFKKVDVAPLVAGSFTGTAGAVVTTLSNGNAVITPTVNSLSTTSYTLTFSGAGIIGGSLADGNYELKTDSSKFGTSAVDSDGDDDLDANDNQRFDVFFRWFGDVDGSGMVEMAERSALLAALFHPITGINTIFDYDGDGDVDSLDSAQFNRRLNKALPGGPSNPFL